MEWDECQQALSPDWLPAPYELDRIELGGWVANNLAYGWPGSWEDEPADHDAGDRH